MTVEELMDLLVMVKHTGNKEGLTDEQIGKLDICVFHKTYGKVDVNFDLRLAKINYKETFVLFEEKEKGKTFSIPKTIKSS